MKNSLHEIGLKYGTDKATFHRYCDFYAKFFDEIRDEKLRILEIGVWKSYSMRMWQEYFSNSEIHGIDYIPNTVPEGCFFHQVNFEIESDVINFSQNCGEFDIIIDDGGHTMLQQQLALKHLWSKAKMFFVMEDLHTSFYPRLNNCNKENLSVTTYDYLCSLKNEQPKLTPVLDLSISKQILQNFSFIDFYEKTPGVKNSGINSSVTCILKRTLVS